MSASGNGQSSNRSYHPWGWVALTAAIFAGLLTAVIYNLVSAYIAPAPPKPSSSIGTKTATGPPVSRPSTSADRIQNLGISIGPSHIPSDGSVYTTIEVSDATPGAYVDLEIAQPAYVNGGVCPRIEPRKEGKCNLVYAGGNEADRDGTVTLKFPTEPGMELHSGLYQITAQDRHTGAVVEIDLSVD